MIVDELALTFGIPSLIQTPALAGVENKLNFDLSGGFLSVAFESLHLVDFDSPKNNHLRLNPFAQVPSYCMFSNQFGIM